MTITASALSTGSNSALSTILRSGGASAKAVDVVASDLAEIEKSASSSGQSSLSTDQLKTALSSKIDEDVASGTLSADDAKAVKQALGLPEQDQASTDGAASGSASATSGAGGAGKAGGHGGGGGGDQQKTEVSRVTTVANGLKTTTITYDDGTTETKTTVTTDPDTKPKNPVEDAYAPGAGGYVQSLPPGSLVQQTA